MMDQRPGQSSAQPMACRGSVEISSNGRQLIYRPAAFFIGTDAFSYDALDQSGSRITRQVMIKSLGSILDSDPALANSYRSQPGCTDGLLSEF